ncbi:uncharacterized protein LOC130046317 isoform X2 [Ostrea edulis]|uniref:uncharacterized protein LOC130046317 isoform X2 n=1 Tax=Ostrea edulis TaxID=37623 RepID=UPI0020941430|nr:uncharacterized protein LOC130046317 isoform X2 [Ostrea edulis]
MAKNGNCHQKTPVKMMWPNTLVPVLCIVIISLPFSLEDKKMCTKRVEGVTTKVPQTRRIPAKCSNWDRAWTWVTHSDCGTKYEITYIELPQSQQYRLVYECCPDDKDCKTAEGQGDHESDERFLAITFGCASAAFIILILIIVISVCRKRHSGFIFCPYKKEYENAAGCLVERSGPNDYIIGDIGEERKLVMESEYEEICDINPAAKEANWDNMYQKSPSAPPEEMLIEDQEPAHSLTNDNTENGELANVAMEGNLVDIEQKELETTLVDIEENNHGRNEHTSNIEDLNITGGRSNDISCDDLNEDVLNIKLSTANSSSLELLQPIKTEGETRRDDSMNLVKNTDCAPPQNFDLMTISSSEVYSEKTPVKSPAEGSMKSTHDNDSRDCKGIYEELK